MTNLDIHKETLEELEAKMVNRFEELSGEALSLSDERRWILQSIAYGLFIRNQTTNEGFKMNFVRYTKGQYADEIGVFTDTGRLPAKPSKTKLRIEIGTSKSQTVAVSPTRFTPGKNIYFQTEYFEFKPGETVKELIATCTVPGEVGNGFLPGEINKVVDPFPFFKSVTNLEKTKGGSEVESDNSLKERIREAPSKFSTAGPVDGYVYWAKSAHQDIVDVNVGKISPGTVRITPLMKNGELPDAGIIHEVHKVCNDSLRRPLTDNLVVNSPEQVTYNIDLTYYISQSNIGLVNEIKDKVNKAISTYISWQKNVLKRDINPSELNYLIRSAGAKRTNIVSPVFKVVNEFQVAKENHINIIFGGVEDD